MDATAVVVGVVGIVVVLNVEVLAVAGVQMPGGCLVTAVSEVFGVVVVSGNMSQDVEYTLDVDVQMLLVTVGGGN